MVINDSCATIARVAGVGDERGARFGCVAYQVSLDAIAGIKALILFRGTMF